ncbi:hypothetical protein AI2618V1_1573 [Serratia marcescens]|uniref:Uncharacterized protein n=2 Tax=Serratia marcescens TaxID=615 RepID=A0AB33FSF4_SERMA|nr:hypothetical protein AB188_05405 [Serratia marcescens]OFS91421.1 hypothetical protein HMPREF3138_10585 [Serratia sp. HMSC15F11]AWL67309.1 hypothetical protein DKC05_06335 [Serratia marcescens]CAE7293643.1 hypothetical protein AI2618V1_1573 [Serratia marcescens]CAE7293681.1 hypothetical protein AI2617V1_1565 [Serratia marcescens]
MRRDLNLAGAFMEALNFNENGKGRRIKTVDFIHAANRLGTHITSESVIAFDLITHLHFTLRPFENCLAAANKS